MASRRRSTALAGAAVAALVVAEAALSVGPDLPALQRATLNAGAARFVVRATGTETTVDKLVAGRVVARTTVPGDWGVQLVTYRGDLAGLSGDGRTLVLSDNVEPNGRLRSSSRFAVFDTRSLALEQRITLRGDYGVDALSPGGDILYLIHHLSDADVTRYQVQAYDLVSGRLLHGVIADKRQAGWVMAGNPVSRVATAGGRRVYTLYQQSDNYPFVHALDAVHRTAICVGLPVDWTKPWLSNATLVLDGGKLKVVSRGETRVVVDTSTFAVSTP
jgi:hypothetical protein